MFLIGSCVSYKEKACSSTSSTRDTRDTNELIKINNSDTMEFLEICNSWMSRNV